MQCNFGLPWKWPVLYALWEQGKIIVSWNSCIQHILSAHPVPVTSGPQGHSGKPGDNIPIDTGLSLIRKIDGSHAVANISKCYQENKAWWGEDSDGCRVIKRHCSKEVTQRRGGGGGTSQVEGRWSLGTRPEGWGRARRGQQTSVRGPGRRWPTWDPLWVPPPGAWAFCAEEWCDLISVSTRSLWLLWRMDKDLAWVKVVKVDQARAGTGLAEGHRGRGLQEVTRKNEDKIQYNTGIAEGGMND